MNIDVDHLRGQFLGALIEDVQIARKRLGENNLQPDRRNLVRATSAAIEGMLWYLRLAAIDYSYEIIPLIDIEVMALREMNYVVRNNGKVEEQIRFVPLLSMVRLLSNIYNKVLGVETIDFSSSEWSNFQQAAEIRNRITHPKSAQDIKIDPNDVEVSQRALFWFFAIAIEWMDKSNKALKSHSDDYRALLENMRAGDPDALNVYALALKMEG